MSELQGRLEAHLRAVWQRDCRLHRSAGLLAVGRFSVALFLVGLAVDWLIGMPRVLRFGYLVGLVLFVAVVAWRRGFGRLRRFDPARVALRVEASHGGLDSVLVSAVQLGGELPDGTSNAMRGRTRQLAESAAASLEPERSVSFESLHRDLRWSLAPLMIVSVLALIDSSTLMAGAARIFAPWLEVEYPTRTQIRLQHGDLVIREGDGLRLTAELTGEIPTRARISLRTGSGAPQERELQLRDGVCAYQADAVFRSFDYRIAAGDARTPWQRVRVIASPRIERAAVQLEYPEYTQRPAEIIEGLTFTVPEGTRVRWQLTLDRPVAEAEFRPIEGDPIPVSVGGDGRTLTLTQLAVESRGYGFGWVDREHGFSFASPRHHVQVAPDRAPAVELTSPDGVSFATLGRQLDFAFRSRDDHGIGSAALTYRVNKTAAARVELPVPVAADGEQAVDWNYREALPDLQVGDTVSFAVEVFDRYPDTPHRARSDARRIRFLSKADYLAQIEKQKRRLLGRVRATYREQRSVHDLVRRLDPSAGEFGQSCQLEAVRQDLIGSRLEAIGDGFLGLVEDLAANGLSDSSPESKELVPLLIGLDRELRRIRGDHLQRAATALRQLGAADAESPRDSAAAVGAVDAAARELGLLVFQLGFAESADVMARELHATAQTQAALRMATVTASAAEQPELQRRQRELADASARLLAATPRNRESTPADAIVAFTLSRLVNELQRTGAERQSVEQDMRTAADLLPNSAGQATAIQARVIGALLRAEFRLRRGAEYEALGRARERLRAQAVGQRELRQSMLELTDGEFAAKRRAMVAAQAALARQLRLLLMPAIPAPRPQLGDVAVPAAPPVDSLLTRAEQALESASGQIDAGNRDAAVAQQLAAESDFEELIAIVSRRLEASVETERAQAMVAALTKQEAQRFMLEERLLVLLEQTEDALDAEADLASLAASHRALTEDVERFGRSVELWSGSIEGAALPWLDATRRASRSLRAGIASLAGEDGDAALESQESALEGLEEVGRLLEERIVTRSAFANVLATTADVLAPSPLLLEIEAEQALLSAVTEDAKGDVLAGLIVPQKNLIHAVDAVLESLDPLAHRIESGTVMLFAKEDMDAAAIGLESDDIEEALDAQSFVVETLQELRGKIDAITPEYRYVRELTEAICEVAPQAAVLRTELRIQRESSDRPEQQLERRVERFGSRLQQLSDASEMISAVLTAIRSGTAPDTEGLDQVVAGLRTAAANLAYLIEPPPLTGAIVEEPTPEVVLLRKVLAIAADHADLLRADAEPFTERAERQRVLSERLGAIHGGFKPLVEAQRQLAAAAALLKRDEAALREQRAAAELLRMFILDSAIRHVQVPPPPPPQDPAPSDDAVPEDGELQLFMPGALTGTKPKGGRVEWQVLGRRDRAALNENFARELPLEYRAILKDYYERLTR